MEAGPMNLRILKHSKTIPKGPADRNMARPEERLDQAVMQPVMKEHTA